MAPAHHVLQIELVGCPDPNPTLKRFFTPARNALPPDVTKIGACYIVAAYREVAPPRLVRRLDANPGGRP